MPTIKHTLVFFSSRFIITGFISASCMHGTLTLHPGKSFRSSRVRGSSEIGLILCGHGGVVFAAMIDVLIS